MTRMLSTQEAADLKGTSSQIIRAAIRRGVIDALRVGGVHIVEANSRFKNWQVSERHRANVQKRWEKR